MVPGFVQRNGIDLSVCTRDSFRSYNDFFTRRLKDGQRPIAEDESVLVSPCDGKVTVTMGHAVGLQSDSGIEVLVHVGVDTVNMNGDGFEGFVKADDVVKAGQPLLKIDRAKIAAAGYKDCVVVAVSNTAEFADVELAVEAESAVAAGDAIVKVVRK